MPEGQGLLPQTLGFRLAVLLQPRRLIADLGEFLQRLLTITLMGLGVGPLELLRLLLQLLAAAGGFLFQLLATTSKLLLHLGHPGLVLLLRLGRLLARLQQQLVPLLASLLAEFGRLALRLLPHPRAMDQLFPFAAGLADDLFSLLAGLNQKRLFLPQQLHRTLHLARQGLAHRIEDLDGIGFVDQPSAREGNPSALENDLFELIELVKHLQSGLVHGSGTSRLPIKEPVEVPCHHRRHHVVHISAETGDFLDHAAAEEAVPHRRGQKQRVDLLRQGRIRMGQLQLEFKIAQGPQPPQDHPRLALQGEVDGEAFEARHLHRRQVAGGLPQLPQALVKTEQGLLVGVAQYRHQHLVEQTAGPFDQIEMPQGDGVEAARIEGTQGPHRQRAAFLHSHRPSLPAIGPVSQRQPLVQDPQRLETFLRSLPAEPGCYLMRDGEDRLLYVGKSKALRSRVRSYFRDGQALSPRIALMVRQVVEIEFIVTDSESEALALESNLIKTHQPHFNVLLKDDKKYPYLCITWSEDYPRIFITRRRRLRSSRDRFYGPYVDVGLLRRTLSIVKRVFPLRQRPQPVHRDRTCLNYDIGRCPGVCQRRISPDDYHATLQRVAMIFQGRNDELLELLKEQMLRSAERLDFEAAARVRDQLQGLELLTADQKMTLPDAAVARDVIALAADDRVAAVQLFQVRAGKLVGRLGYTADATAADPGTILQRVLEEHYSQVDPVEIPPEVLLQHPLPEQELLEGWLRQRRGRKVVLLTPQRQQKAELIELVVRNAGFELARAQRGAEQQQLALEDLAQLLDLDQPPRRIEGYDISHIQGSDAVASQVVFVEGLPAKQHYRRYRLRSSSIGAGHSDDFMAMAEIMRRRFRRWSEAKAGGADLAELRRRGGSSLHTDGFGDWPDVVMIDGGKGQLSAVMEALRELDLAADLRVCSLAKQREEVFLPGEAQPLESETEQLGVQLLRRLRDEAHRFAVSFHRQQRGERMTRSRLSDIPGLGPKRVRDLLAHFRSVDAIQLASAEQIAACPGVGPALAAQIHAYFHPAEVDG